MADRYLRMEFVGGSSRKFYAVTLHDDKRTATVHWGRIGTRGSFQTVSYSEGLKKVDEKLAKGYKRVGDWQNAGVAGASGAIRQLGITARDAEVLLRDAAKVLRPKPGTKTKTVRTRSRRVIDLD